MTQYVDTRHLAVIDAVFCLTYREFCRNRRQALFLQNRQARRRQRKRRPAASTACHEPTRPAIGLTAPKKELSSAQSVVHLSKFRSCGAPTLESETDTVVSSGSRASLSDPVLSAERAHRTTTFAEKKSASFQQQCGRSSISQLAADKSCRALLLNSSSPFPALRMLLTPPSSYIAATATSASAPCSSGLPEPNEASNALSSTHIAMDAQDQWDKHSALGKLASSSRKSHEDSLVPKLQRKPLSITQGPNSSKPACRNTTRTAYAGRSETSNRAGRKRTPACLPANKHRHAVASVCGPTYVPNRSLIKNALQHVCLAGTS